MSFKKILLSQLFFSLLLFSFLDSSQGRTADENSIDVKRNKLIGYILSRQLPALHFSDKAFDDQMALAAFDLYIKQLDYQKRFLLKSDVEQLEVFAPYIDDNVGGGRIILPDTGFALLGEKIDQVQAMVEQMLASDTISGKDREVLGNAVKAPFNYTVVAGDTLLGIAARYNWIEVEDLLKANEIDNPAALSIGQKLIIDRFRPGVEGELLVGNFNVLHQELYETDPEKLGFAKDFDELKDRWQKILKTQLISAYLELKKEQDDKELQEELAQQKSANELWKEAISKIKKRNKIFFHRLHQETLQDHYDRFFNCLTRAFGPHTNYIPPAGKEQFDINMRGSLEGIGALLREDDGYIKVVRIIPGSASAREGSLKAEDTLLEVAQEGEEPVDITEMRLRDAVRLIRGPKGEAVTLTVKKLDGTKEIIRIVRDVVQIEETFVKSTIIESADGRRTGYVYIPSFYRDFEAGKNGGTARNSTDDTRLEIEKLKRGFVDGIILDLRDDGGGALIDAVDITGLFIESGPVVQVKNSFGEQRVLEDRNESVYYDGPMVVLVNQFSASASEIVAAALQDYRRAVIVGSKHTHGKGTVQTVINLNDNIPLLHLRKYSDLGALKIMIQKFYRVTGSSTQYKGVEPDIILPNLFEHLKSGERYLDYSLPWDSIDGVEYESWAKADFDLGQLREKSMARIAVDPGLTTIKKEAAKAAARSEETKISIHLEDMRQKSLASQIMREKVGAHYRKYREDEDGEPAGDESNRRWLEEVNEDPYIHEAVNIIGDMIQFQGS